MALHLLIVEPDRALLETYRAYFERVGLDTTTATDGATAREHFLGYPIDTVMLEPDLPDDSMEFLRAVADHTHQRPLPVVIVSRRTQPRLNFPVQCYHVKPVSMTRLLDGILLTAQKTRHFKSAH